MRLGHFGFFSISLVVQFLCRFAFDMFVFFIGFSFSTALFFPYYYHLNINVVGYNSVGFIILCTERTAHSGHLYHSPIYYARVLILVYAEPFCYWLALEIADETFEMCMLVHIQSNYFSNKNTGNISEKSEIKVVLFFQFSFHPFFVWECQSFFPLCTFNARYLILCILLWFP